MKKNGFTLIELLVTIALIAIITTIVVVNMTGLQQNENEELYTAYKSRITTAACNYIDNMENENLRNWCKATSTGCKIYISTLVNEGLVDGEEVDPKTNIKLKDETTSAYIIVDWTEDNGYKVKKCAFYDDENNKSVDELDLSSDCKYSQTFVGTTLNVTYGCDEDKAVYGCKTADKTISYSDNASDLKWTIEDNYNHKATCSHAIVLTKKYTVKHYQMNIDGTYPDEPTEVDEDTALIGTSVSPNVKTYEGFISPDKQTLVIKDDENNIVNYYYLKKFEITYNLDGGINNTTNPTTYTINDELTIKSPTKEDAIFTGWTGSNGTELQNEIHITKGTTGNLIYNANWNEDILVWYGSGMNLFKLNSGSLNCSFYNHPNPIGNKYYGASYDTAKYMLYGPFSSEYEASKSTRGVNELGRFYMASYFDTTENNEENKHDYVIIYWWTAKGAYNNQRDDTWGGHCGDEGANSDCIRGVFYYYAIRKVL